MPEIAEARVKLPKLQRIKPSQSVVLTLGIPGGVKWTGKGRDNSSFQLMVCLGLALCQKVSAWSFGHNPLVVCLLQINSLSCFSISNREENSRL
jgi:hypothetical protein